MQKVLFLMLMSLVLPLPLWGWGKTCDVCVYGETASGCMAAIQAARMGKTVVLVAQNEHVGGMVTSGLTATDMNKHAYITGLPIEFYEKIYEYYLKPQSWFNQNREEYMVSTLKRTYTGKNDNRRIQWVYESGVAERILKDMLSEAGVKIISNARLKESKRSVCKFRSRIRSVRLTDGTKIKARQYIDCSYEGDLMAAAGVSYAVGRESCDTYHESLAGIRVHKDSSSRIKDLFPYKEGRLLPLIDSARWGKDGTADGRVQAYCYRVTLTDDVDNMIPIEVPEHYNPDYYEVLLTQILNTPDIQLKNIITFTPMPNRKTDTNHLDMFGGSYSYPEADYATRAQIAEDHKDYALGMLWFLGHDERVPQYLRDEMLRWGLAADEYPDSDHFPYQLYVREARRMVGTYVVTQKDLEKDQRPLVEDCIAIGTYPVDCHFVSTVYADGELCREGTVFQPVTPYPIPYCAIVPKREECTNLLVPVCLSASHVAFCSIRMEPQYMVLGQSAAIAACKCIDDRCRVQDFNYIRHKELFSHLPELK